jgi:acyl-coenzyme A synthetase/AMP-(fatty) acid ligase
VAIIWESPVTGSTETYTYAQLLDEIEVLAGVLGEEGVKKGDVVIIYSMHSPNTPTMAVTYPYPYPQPHPRHHHNHPHSNPTI